MAKYLIGVVILLILPILVLGNDLSVVYTDLITTADTADERVDTVLTPVMDIRGYSAIQFYSKLTAHPYLPDSNWTDDSFFVYAQTSANQIQWKSHPVDTFLTNDSGFSASILVESDSVFGNYLRGMIIHWDSIAVGEADTGSAGQVGNSYYKLFDLWVMPK